MHEYSVTKMLVEKALEEASAHSAVKVTEVHIAIGELTFLGTEQVRFTYDILAKGTKLEGSRLYIEEKRGVVSCPQCNYKGGLTLKADDAWHIFYPTLTCPMCDGCVTVLEGKECILKRIKMEA